MLVIESKYSEYLKTAFSNVGIVDDAFEAKLTDHNNQIARFKGQIITINQQINALTQYLDKLGSPDANVRETENIEKISNRGS